MVALKALSLGLLASQAWAVPTTSQTALSSPAASSAAVAAAAAKLEQLSSYALDQTLANLPSSSEDSEACTRETLRIRRDWRTFSKPEKEDYINSVLCLQELPSRTPSHLAPGAKTRYDDFLATHINQTLEIHYTVHLATSLPPSFRTLTSTLGNLPRMAPLLHLRVRTSPPR